MDHLREHVKRYWGMAYRRTLGISLITASMVLAIGLVVDDAIVVLENITRHIEEGESILSASIKGSKEIGFAIVAMTLTLCSVYAPLAFITGTIDERNTAPSDDARRTPRPAGPRTTCI